ncbi:sulfatase-like hydrolase/transferase [Paenibacillus sp. y28]|uniref:sulfatase-like hydrolase/transferase n=1 Tax=Paenibacillus sp. y28 TaxID=3129110 RepID=UPI0030173328
MNPLRRPGSIPGKPNFLLLIVDEQRYPPVYESQEIRDWREKHLPAQAFLRKHGMELHAHHIGSAACCPSRATMLTGHYPSLHGVTQTNGMAKSAFDSDMFWLNRNTVPTMGNYFREAGYQTYYKGKWHISYEDIVVPGTETDVTSYDPVTGVPDRQREELYLHANPLEPFGFSSWIGPEPHGRNPRNSASSAAIGLSGRDTVYGAETVALIEALDRQKGADPNAKPWLVAASFVNPHDITLYGSLTEQLTGLFRFDVGPMPQVPAPPTLHESLHTKPRCQASYRDIYPLAIQPIHNQPFYRKLYCQLQKNADQQLMRVLDALKRSSFYDETIVIFTSDHGDMQGAHGGLYQKMYCAYQEVLHVPFLLHNRRLFPEPEHFTELTSHVDLLPTMLGLAGVNAEHIQQRLNSSFSEVRPFVGRDLTPSLLYGKKSKEEQTVYFMTDDDMTRGQRQVNALGAAYPSVMQPNHIETVITELPLQDSPHKQRWKYSRYFDNKQFWSDPGARDITVQLPWSLCSNPQQPASCIISCKTVPVPEEYELYNLTADPLETRNLAYPAWATPESEKIRIQMSQLLEEQRKLKRLTPRQNK